VVISLRNVSVLLLACLIGACGGGESGTGAAPPSQDKVTFASSTTLTVGTTANIEPQ
jgi:ABC-type glycerol-3-phosphate transport system substrate-binding protein